MQFSIEELGIIRDCLENAIEGQKICEMFGNAYTEKEMKCIKETATKIHNYLETFQFRMN